ncbi:MAG TPA: alpha/beta hydrolase [Burkholderiales bacterium]|nr:alpha/beta hydrolase [Burkholderiales bacterium]
MQDTQQYYERQYNNRLSIPDAQDYNLRGVARSEAARKELKCHLDAAYGDSARERIDIYPADGADAPLLVFIHGGYWRSRSKSEFSFLAQPFVKAGVSVAMPTYDLAPQVTVEHIVRQALAAHAWLYRNGSRHGVNPRRMYVAGHSAGGHLAAMMIAARWPEYAPDLPEDLVKGGLAVSGIFDLMPLLSVSFNAEVRLDERSARKASPLSYYPARAVPLHTAAGELESDEFKRQARLIAQAWPHCHAGHLEVPGRHHLSILEALAEPGNALFERAMQMMRAS